VLEANPVYLTVWLISRVTFGEGAGGNYDWGELMKVGRRSAWRVPVAMLTAVALVAGACGSDAAEDTTSPAATTAAPAATTAAPAATTAAPAPEEVGTVADHLGDGSLGTIEVGSGEEIQIRSLNAISGDVAFLGIPNQRGVEMAIADYGPIGGHDVSMGTGLDDLCSADGGQAAAQMIVADEDVVGVIGTSCSGAAAAAAPLISEAGMVMISGSNTSPSLTSDLAGTAGSNNYPGYYRTAHNDLYQGAAAAGFAIEVLGVTTAAAIHDGDPYTQGLAQAFADAFEALGGTITTFTAVNKGDSDMIPVLTEIAAGAPEMLFFPIFQPEGDFIVQQASEVAGLEGITMMAADGLLNSNYMAIAETEGMYFSGPDIRYGTNSNQSTGQTADGFLAAYNDEWGEDPAAPFWAHSYDATTLLLDAIAAASYDDDGTLVIDRAGVREYLGSVTDYSGIIGLMSCDAFGDCGSQKITVIGHADSGDVSASNANVIYEYAPGGSSIVGTALVGVDAECPLGRSTEVAADMLPLRAVIVPIVDVAPVVYAARCGIYAAHGLEVTIETASSGPAAAQIVAAGEGDMGITAWHPLSAAWANGAPFSVVIDGATLAAAQGKVMVSPDSDIETLADLAGRTVGVAAMGSVFHVALLTAFQDAGIDASTVEIIAVPITEEIAAVQSGSIDAMLALEPFTTIGQMQGLKVIADNLFGGRVEQGSSGGFMAMTPWAMQNEETIRRTRAAWAQVVELIQADEAGFRAFIPTYTALTPELAAVISLTVYRTTTEVANIQPSVDLTAEVGLIAETFDVEPFVAYPQG